MNNKLGGFFTKDAVFQWCTVLAVILLAANGMMNVIAENYVAAAPIILTALCLLFLYSSYLKHEKNVMKGMIGMLLGIILMGDLDTVTVNMSDTTDAAFVVALITVIVDILFCINHFMINSQHMALSKRVTYNQVLIIVEFAVIIAADVLVFNRNVSVLVDSTALVDMLGYIFTFGCIACIESKIDAYKLEREKLEAEGNWNEESKAELKEKVFGE